MWDQDAIDLVQPGFIEFSDDGLGQFGFIAVNGELTAGTRRTTTGRSGILVEGNDDGKLEGIPGVRCAVRNLRVG